MLPTDRTPITLEGAPVPLLLNRMTGTEELGRLFQYELELFSDVQVEYFPDTRSSG